ncbi:MAG: hypothetical protein RSE64_08045, partial [Oscillospiraceae bacterium]
AANVVVGKNPIAIQSARTELNNLFFMFIPPPILFFVKGKLGTKLPYLSTFISKFRITVFLKKKCFWRKL